MFLFLNTVNSQQVATLKYNGGGDWYSNPTALPNLIDFCNKNINTNIDETSKTVAVNSIDLFNYPIVFMTGHGNIIFSDDDAKNLESCVRTMREVGVDGFIIAAVCLKEPIVDELVAQNFPVVLFTILLYR